MKDKKASETKKQESKSQGKVYRVSIENFKKAKITPKVGKKVNLETKEKKTVKTEITKIVGDTVVLKPLK